jgi:hypothetical protein
VGELGSLDQLRIFSKLNGNRLTKTFNGTPTNYTYDNADQLTK